MPKKQSGNKLSELAFEVLAGCVKPSTAQAKKLAASILSQDETCRTRPPPKKR
jgi:hypothetical protein